MHRGVHWCIHRAALLPLPSDRMDGNHEDGRFGAHVLFGLFHSSMRQEGRVQTRLQFETREKNTHVQNKEMFGNDPFKTTLGRPILVGWLIEWMAGWHSLVSMHSMDSMDSNPWLPWISWIHGRFMVHGAWSIHGPWSMFCPWSKTRMPRCGG